MSLIETYFPNLTQRQKDQFNQLEEIYHFWNNQINVISRKDTEHFLERHVLHSLGIARVISFADSSKILDIGTGGGFPGIPLAILFPNCKFTLADSIGKKIKVVNEVAKTIGLSNVTGIHDRAENITIKADFIVSRAVTAMAAFLPWTYGKFSSEQKNQLKNGILYLKGGDLSEEMSQIKRHYEIFELSNFFKEEFFETKKVVYVPNE
jgi:16S rRNA (guanine527-N7)-methyltransferase